jgi:hypothetical protein
MAFLTGYASISRRAATGIIPIIARSHPLANGLLLAYYPAAFPGGALKNLATPGLLDLVTRVNANSYNINTPEGPGLNTRTGTAQISSLPASFAPTAITLFVRGQWTAANPATPARIFGIYMNTSNFIGSQLEAGPNYAGSVVGTIGAYYTASSTNIYIPGGTLTPTVNSMISAGGTWLAGAALPLLYINGIKQVLQGSSLPTMNFNAGEYVSTGQLGMGEYFSSTRNGATTITVAYMWNRILGDADMVYLHNNPYSLLQWPIDVVYDVLEEPAALPGTPTPNNKAIFWSPLTVGLGGAAAASRIISRNPLVTRRRLLRPWE